MAVSGRSCGDEAERGLGACDAARSHPNDQVLVLVRHFSDLVVDNRASSVSRVLTLEAAGFEGGGDDGDELRHTSQATAAPPIAAGPNLIPTPSRSWTRDPRLSSRIVVLPLVSPQPGPAAHQLSVPLVHWPAQTQLAGRLTCSIIAFI